MSAHVTPQKIARICGAVLILLALSVMLGWVLRIPAWTRWRVTDPAMVFNSALGAFMCGFALVQGQEPGRARVARGVGAVLVVLSLMVLTEHLAGVDLAVDWHPLHAWLNDRTTFPGRMSMATAWGFLCAGSALTLSARPPTERQALAIKLLTWLVGVTGMLGIGGYLVQAQLLFPGYPLAGMAVQTAVAMVVIAVGLAARWKAFAWGRTALLADQVDRITASSAAVLTAIALAGGILCFSILQGRVQDLVGESVRTELAGRITTMQNFLTLRESLARTAAEHREAVAALRALDVDHADPRALAAIQPVIENFRQLGFSGIAYYGATGEEVARGGVFVPTTPLAVLLGAPITGTLIWQQSFVLRHRIEMSDNGRVVGHVVTEQPLPVISAQAFAASRLGTTVETGLCVARPPGNSCFPQRANPRHYTTQLNSVDGSPLPMTLALRGQSGVAIFRDYRGQNVVAAYGPVGTLGLGMVVKIDAVEVFSPIREQLLWAMGALLVLVIAGTLLMRWRMQPLIVELMRSSSALRENQEQFATVVAGVTDYAIIMLDLQGHILNWNAGAQAIKGYTAGEIIGQHFSIFYPQDPVAQAKPARELEIVSATGRYEEEGWRVRKDGSLFWANVIITALRGDDGQLRGFVKFTRDRTERMQLEQALVAKNAELERVSRARDVFLANMSHELRTPLNAIIGFTGVLLMKLAGPLLAEQEKQLRLVQSSGRHLLSLINDLLNIAKVDADKQEFQLEAVQCGPMVEEVAAMLKPQADKKGLVLVVNQPDEPLTMRTDRRALRQILLNLAGNAIKFTAQGSVTLALSHCNAAERSLVCIRVIDTGPGIDEALQHQLFEPFARVRTADTVEIEGAGLGLHLSRKLAEKLGGTIALESTPGHGSTFELSLPAQT